MKQGSRRRNRRLERKRRILIRLMVRVCMVLVVILVVLAFVKRKKLFDGDGSNQMPEGPVLEPVSVKDFLELPAGTVVDISQLDKERLSEYFSVNEIGDDVFQRINGKSYVENENIGIDELRYLKMPHYNYDHRIQIGEMIVNAGIAEDVRNIFLELFDQDYEIAAMYLVEEYWTGDGESTDKNSIENNNTSAFNYRTIPGLSDLSNHALGYAVDVNPLQNPYVAYNEDGSFRETYKDMERYIDRSAAEAHMIGQGDICYQTFTKYGFTWGGDWEGVKDYQHFEKR